MSTNTPSSPAGFDLDDAPDVVALEDAGIRYTYKDALGEPMMAGGKPVTALIAGVYSTRATSAKTRLLERNLKRGRQTAESIEAGQLKLDAALIIEWDFTMAGTMASPEVVFARRPDLREQTVEVANNHADFIAAASTQP